LHVLLVYYVSKVTLNSLFYSLKIRWLTRQARFQMENPTLKVDGKNDHDRDEGNDSHEGQEVSLECEILDRIIAALLPEVLVRQREHLQNPGTTVLSGNS
jgi:hypothetical protein